LTGSKGQSTEEVKAVWGRRAAWADGWVLKVQAFWQEGEGQLGQMNPYNLSHTQVLEGALDEEEPKSSPFSSLPGTCSLR